MSFADHGREVMDKMSAENDELRRRFGITDAMLNQGVVNAKAPDQCNTMPGAALAGKAYADSSNSAQESLETRCIRRFRDGNSEATKYSRILDILTRHPEFHEMLELLRLLPPSELR